MIYFDNAATTGKKPESVINAVKNSMLFLSANPGRSGHRLSLMTAEKVYEARSKTAEFFGADGPENVVFTANCTESLNFVIKGCLKKGDFAAVSDLEHNAVMRPLFKSGIDYSAFKVSLYDDAETLEEVKSLVSKRPKMLICTGASNVLGKKLPVREIGKLCRENGVLFALDAAQTAGIESINMNEMGIDYLCVAPHKGLYAPMGMGILIANKPIQETIIEGGTGTDSVNLAQPESLPERFESGTINVPGIMGLSAGMDFIRRIGLKRIEQKEMSVIREIYKGLRKNEKVILYTPEPDVENFAPVLSFNLYGKNSMDTASDLNRCGIAVRAGLHCAPTAHRKIGTLETGTVRICASVFNNKDDARRFIYTLDELTKKY